MKFICSFNKRLMGTYYVPGTVLDAGSTSGRLQNLEVREAKQLDLEELESLIHSHRQCLKTGL